MRSPEALGRVLFLKWTLVNLLVVVGLIVGASLFSSKIHGASLVAVPIILVVLFSASIFGGRLCWRASGYVTPVGKLRILHDAHYLSFAAWTCQILGIMSTLIGFWMLLSNNTEVADLASRIQAGAGVALLGSFVGVFSSLILGLIHRMLEHELGI